MTVGSLWEVVGGVDTGGIIVRTGKELSSEKTSSRLSTGALVKEEALVDGRLLYVKMEGVGPGKGWVSLSVKEKSLLIPCKESKKTQVSLQTNEVTTESVSEWNGPPSDAEWRAKLSHMEYEILRHGGTEAPGSHEYNNFFPKSGHFVCAGCGLALYSCNAKFPDGCGWPCWDECLHSKQIGCHVGASGAGSVYEIHCARCEGHLGHVFFGERHTPKNERH
mmetsp:Transcript_44615/g.78421  ORF Transcript_44615/g.78421 Transcript_44615/m.78421 type:complete len:221 (-) Transcript_44615:397-1059(-)